MSLYSEVSTRDLEVLVLHRCSPLTSFASTTMSLSHGPSCTWSHRSSPLSHGQSIMMNSNGNVIRRRWPKLSNSLRSTSSDSRTITARTMKMVIPRNSLCQLSLPPSLCGSAVSLLCSKVSTVHHTSYGSPYLSHSSSSLLWWSRTWPCQEPPTVLTNTWMVLREWWSQIPCGQMLSARYSSQLVFAWVSWLHMEATTQSRNQSSSTTWLFAFVTVLWVSSLDLLCGLLSVIWRTRAVLPDQRPPQLVWPSSLSQLLVI